MSSFMQPGQPASGIIPRLAVAQALYLASAAIGFTFSGLVGARLAPEASLATLPIALMTVATMLFTLPASLLMERFGRRFGFVLGAAMGLAGACLSSWAIVRGSFPLFCTGSAMLGAYQAFAMYYRFAAAEAVVEAAKGRAVGWVLTGGVVAALGAGAAQTHLGWTAVNQLAAPLVLVALIASVWLAAHLRSVARHLPRRAER